MVGRFLSSAADSLKQGSDGGDLARSADKEMPGGRKLDGRPDIGPEI